MTYTFSTGSGYLNSPARIVLIGDDNRPGTYPVDISPALAAKSSEYAKPYRDDIFPDTQSPYAQAHVVFTAVPNESESITLTNAQGQAHTFTFKLTSPNFATGPTSYDVSYDMLSSTPREGDDGLSRSQVVTKRALEKFVEAVNRATGSLITASPTSYYGRAILTQRIPGTAGNTANSTTSADVTIQSFTGGNAGEIRYPFGIIASGSGEVLRRVLSTAESGTLDVPAAGNASLLSAYSDGHPYAIFQPYDESNAQQAFGIATGGSSEYGTQTRLTDEFFTRGSTLGNLDEPLSTKDKIVIDLTPKQSTTLQYQNVPGQNYPMAYWNFEKSVWERIGFGTRPQGFSTLSAEMYSYMLGFGQADFISFNTASLLNLEIYDKSLETAIDYNKLVFRETGWSTCVDTFGFPAHTKFHATSSQYIDAGTLIDRPFLVEKLVYEFSGSSSGQPQFQESPAGSSGFFRTGGGTFFILNQRKANPTPDIESAYVKVNVAISQSAGSSVGGTFVPPHAGINSKQVAYGVGPIPTTMNVSLGGPAIYIDDIRDLVTYARVGTIHEGYKDFIDSKVIEQFPHPANYMDLAVEVPNGGTLGGKYTLAADVKSSTYVPSLGLFETWNIEPNKPRVAGNQNAVYLAKESNTRNSVDIPTGRSKNAEYSSSEIVYKVESYPKVIPSTDILRSYGMKKDAIESPYVILPGDKLIFGWQSLLSFGYSTAGPSFTLKPGAGKLTLYGSYLQDDKPVHDIYKDQLNSDAAHEAIPSGPWVLDRFETEPQMCYSGSMREEHVTGTMLVRGATGSLDVTSVNNFSIGGVRAVSARVSDGNVRQRWSFFRNNRLIDSEEQYYDSMQPNPLDVFRITDPNYGLVGGYDGGASPAVSLRYLIFMIPGETYVTSLPFGPYPDINGFFNDYAVKNWLGSFAFEGNIKDLPRNKSLDSRLFSRTLITGSDFISIAGANSYPTTATELYFLTGSAGSTINDLAPLPHSNMGAPGGLYKKGFAGEARSLLTNEVSDTNPVPDSLGTIYGGNGTSVIRDEVTQKDSVGRSTNFHVSRFVGCFGDGYLQIVQFQKDFSIGGSYFGSGMIYRGVKHGLINPTPFFSNAVFNGTRHGQLRDMMEQRQYTRFSLSDNTLTEAAISVQFINRNAPPGTLNITSGSATNSSNISKFATSEHPYDDALVDLEQIWDRSTALPETLIAL